MLELLEDWPNDPYSYFVLARAEIENHPELYKKFYSQTEFTWGTTMGGGEPTRSSIAVSDGELFIRTAETLYCVGK